MRPRSGTAASLLATVFLSACGPSTAPDTSPARPQPTNAAIPASLAPFGEGYPNPGDPCRRLGESPATSNWLDDSAILVGCPTAESAASLGGQVVDTVHGVSLVSIPTGDANAGMGEGQPAYGEGDALVPGTRFNAVAPIPCSFDGSEPKAECQAGIRRRWGANDTHLVQVTKPDGTRRSFFFRDTTPTSGDGSEADGSAAFELRSERRADATLVIYGRERYLVPDMLINGG